MYSRDPTDATSPVLPIPERRRRRR